MQLTSFDENLRADAEIAGVQGNQALTPVVARVNGVDVGVSRRWPTHENGRRVVPSREARKRAVNVLHLNVCTCKYWYVWHMNRQCVHGRVSGVCMRLHQTWRLVAMD